MRVDDYIDRLLEQGIRAGFIELEVLVQSNRTLSARIFQQELDSYSLADSRGLGLRGCYRGRMGYAYAEKLDDDSLTFLLDEAKSNAAQFEDEEEEQLQAPSPSYPSFCGHNAQLAQWEGSDVVSQAQDLAARAREQDDRVQIVNTGVATEQREVILKNTLGVDLRTQLSLLSTYVSVIAGERERRTGMRMQIVGQLAMLDVAAMVQGAVQDAVGLFGAQPVKSGRYPSLLRSDVAADFLSTFWPAFSAEQGQKGMSLLYDKLGEAVASPLLDIVDHGILAGRSGSTPFDGEGVATSSKHVVQQGVLLTHLHNSKTARRAQTHSTGNAARASYKTSVSVAPGNFCIAAGEGQPENLIASLTRGLFITDVQGLHSGANPVSGDFSLAASGYEIVEGQLARPVDRITIAGNFFRLLEDIEAVGHDVEFRSRFAAPSLLVKELTVAGT